MNELNCLKRSVKELNEPLGNNQGMVILNCLNPRFTWDY